ncbi:MAG: glycoside hydrolase family 65 protein [Candidatus Omnitrophica bacterium]|nr:glycoside hydrolase family 65 protein [Candidatus Omnitrophota bacterium]
MEKIYRKYAEDELWLIKQSEFEEQMQGINETHFSLGNGYIGSRGVLEEMPKGSAPGTYIAGVYDKLAGQVSEMVNFPNPFIFNLSVQDEKIGASTMEIISHKRALNMKKGVLVRKSKFKSSKDGNIFSYQSLRYVSMADKNIGVMQIMLTSKDADCTIDVQTEISTSVFNRGSISENDKKHFTVKEQGIKKNAEYLLAETIAKESKAVYWSGLYYELEGKKIFAKENNFKIKLKKGKPIKFTKIFYLKRFEKKENEAKIKEETFKKFYSIFKSPINDITDRHISAWAKIWAKRDILIKGTANLQNLMRFNIYHMIICGTFDNGFSSIGARTLSGEGCKGHVFWDAEIYLLPYYLFNDPDSAKNILLYRYNRLEDAREIAKYNGYDGAMFPWESANTGFDETPPWEKDINGRIVEIFTNELEQHITPDIAYATMLYYTATGDNEFMEKYGYELMFETARFVSSRLEFNKKKKVYEIKNVIGPDEFHIGVDNSAFTNQICKWNMQKAHELYLDLKKNSPAILKKIAKKISFQEDEMKSLKIKSDLIKMPHITKEGVIEQHDGYFKLRNAVFENMDENGMPILPQHMGSVHMEKTQFIKQCDVLLMLYLLPEYFPQEKYTKPNYDYYMPRTSHKSSLSASTASVMASKAGDLYRSYHLFNVSLRTDISNLYGNTNGGMHAACLGGTYQALIFGFGGFSINEGMLTINPCMPRTWENLIFTFCWKGKNIKFEISNDIVKLRINSKDKEPTTIKIFNNIQTIDSNKTFTYLRGISEITKKFYY